jgi:hypothetical protein
MSRADILFQYQTTTANTDTSEAELAFQAEQSGTTMVTSLFAASSAGGTANVYRVHHCGPDEEPAPANVIIYAKSTANATLAEATQSVKIILNPGDRIFCQLHSGDGITISAYGLRPLLPLYEPGQFSAERAISDDGIAVPLGMDRRVVEVDEPAPGFDGRSY